MSDLTILAAQPTHIDAVEALLLGASKWLASRGIDQWQYQPRREQILASISRNECFLAQRNGVAIGTITLDTHADPEFWTEDDVPSSALYVHRMSVARAVAGQEIGGALLDWAVERAGEASKRWLRLDAWKSNPGLHRYYAAQGFSLIRVVDLPHRESGALFQRPA